MSVPSDILELKTSLETREYRIDAIFADAQAAFAGTVADGGAGGGSL
ncbi:MULTISPECIES: hypothetical protein [Mycobacteriaceae]|uniref:Uncharacterized protein n=1 Tax=Mycolicibacterium lutetiense TaxID=1641992 RepID=A0ABS4ZRP7_9MYCO|nr:MULTISPECIES: hypothetical protein [Mycobacteriaceae]MBP2451876.1 hypothetical protein [Mycolicibacterium lutetiense]